MKIALYCAIAFGVLLCAGSIVANWFFFGYRAAGIEFSGIVAIFGIFAAFESIDRMDDDESDDN